MNIPLELTTVNYEELKPEIERLRKLTKRDVEITAIACCDFDKSCNYCGGEGRFFIAAYSFCDHVVQNGEDTDCIEGDCHHREYLASIEREEALETMT